VSIPKKLLGLEKEGFSRNLSHTLKEKCEPKASIFLGKIRGK